MSRHSTGITPGYVNRVMYYQRMAQIDRVEQLKAEITVLANFLVAYYGKEGYDQIVDEQVPENAPYEQVRDIFWDLLNQEECHCVLPEQSCPRCRAAATADLAPDEIPY